MSESARRYEADKTEWDRIAETREFKDLLAIKKTFIIPAFVFFIVYYFRAPNPGRIRAANSCRPRSSAWSTSPTSSRFRNSSWLDHRVAVRQSCQQLRRAGEEHHQGSRSHIQSRRRSDKMSTPLVMFLVFIAITLGITYWAARRSAGTQRLLRRRPPDHGLAERHCRGRRLHERRFIPRHRRASSPSRATTASCTRWAGWSRT